MAALGSQSGVDGHGLYRIDSVAVATGRSDACRPIVDYEVKMEPKSPFSCSVSKYVSST